MDCKYVEDRVWLYVEGDLERKQQQAVARHVALCRRCAGAVEEATSSQEWLRSSEAAPFDETFMATVRMGTRNRIAELKGSRLRSVGVFARLNWKPLIIACPSLLLVCWCVVHWPADRKPNRGSDDRPAMSDVFTPKEQFRRTDAGPLVGRNINDKDVAPHTAVAISPISSAKRRVKKRLEQAPQDEIEDGAMLGTIDSSAPPLRIEIQTDDPNVRIIWFAFPGDGWASTGPDK